MVTTKLHYDLSTLIILDTIPNKKIEIFCESKVYEDVKEEIIYDV